MPTPKKSERIEFVRAVEQLIRDRHAGRQTSIDDAAVATVANAWMAMHNALELTRSEIQKSRDPRTFTETGLRDAEEVLGSLLSGRAHPVWNYLDGIRTIAAEKKVRQLATPQEQFRRDVIVAFVTTYQLSLRPTKITEVAARKTIAEVFSYGRHRLTEKMIAGWSERSELSPRQIESLARDLLRMAEALPLAQNHSLPDRVIAKARQYAATLSIAR